MIETYAAVSIRRPDIEDFLKSIENYNAEITKIIDRTDEMRYAYLPGVDLDQKWLYTYVIKFPSRASWNRFRKENGIKTACSAIWRRFSEATYGTRNYGSYKKGDSK